MHMNCLPFLMSTKWEAVLKRCASFKKHILHKVSYVKHELKLSIRTQRFDKFGSFYT